MLQLYTTASLLPLPYFVVMTVDFMFFIGLVFSFLSFSFSYSFRLPYVPPISGLVPFLPRKVGLGLSFTYKSSKNQGTAIRLLVYGFGFISGIYTGYARCCRASRT